MAVEKATDGSAANTPFGSAPSSPRDEPFAASAPVSPSRSFLAVPFFWEDSPAGTPKQHQLHSNDFDFGHPPTNADAAATADELFDGGVIRPLNPPPRLQSVAATSSPKSPRALHRSPKSSAKPDDDFDPFERALVEATRGRAVAGGGEGTGRRRAARSLSPLRGVYGFHAKPSAGTDGGEVTVRRCGSWKWMLKELLLFRSRSEGRVTGNQNRDVLRKYTEGARVARGSAATEDVRNSSFRSTESFGSVRRVIARDGGGSVGGSSRREVSMHELHYTTKRAVSKEQRKKTFLPYRQGLLSCLGFAPTLPIHDMAKGFGSVGGHRS